MSGEVIVPDASVVIKQIKEEADSHQALALLKAVTRNKVQAFAPELLRYELLGAALHVGMPLHECGELLDDLCQFGLSLIAPDKATLELTEQIATYRIAGDGYPGLNDSIYHAMAIKSEGTFVTADQRHYEKTKHFGGIMLLNDWYLANT